MYVAGAQPEDAAPRRALDIVDLRVLAKAVAVHFLRLGKEDVLRRKRRVFTAELRIEAVPATEALDAVDCRGRKDLAVRGEERQQGGKPAFFQMFHLAPPPLT